MITMTLRLARAAGSLAGALLLASSSQALAEDWHVSDWGNAAVLPTSDNDGPGNRLGRSSCVLDMNRSGTYEAYMFVYRSGNMLPYSSASVPDTRSWEILSMQIGKDGIANQYNPNLFLVNRCTTADGSESNEEEFASGWQPVGYEQSTGDFTCPDYKPVLRMAWCKTAVWW